MQSKIENLLKSTNRDGIDKLLMWMRLNGFYNAPCSSQYHLCEQGGLAKHSINVYNQMNKIASEMLTTKEYVEMLPSITICSLLHDLGKMGDYGKQNYVANILKSGKQSDAKPYEINKDLMYLPHEVKSIVIAERFIELTEAEEQAIYYHNGKYTHIGNDLKETPLQMMLHFADLWASRVIEK